MNSKRTAIGAFVKARRVELGYISQAKCAEATGLPITTIASIESGLSKHPRVDTLLRLAAALEVDISELYRLTTPYILLMTTGCGECSRLKRLAKKMKGVLDEF